MHLLVEVLDKSFGNVCELDLIFNFTRSYCILDDIFSSGELQECCRASILAATQTSDAAAEAVPEMGPKSMDLHQPGSSSRRRWSGLMSDWTTCILCCFAQDLRFIISEKVRGRCRHHVFSEGILCVVLRNVFRHNLHIHIVLSFLFPAMPKGITIAASPFLLSWTAKPSYGVCQRNRAETTSSHIGYQY